MENGPKNMIDSRKREDCIEDGSWEKLTNDQKYFGLAEWCTYDFTSEDFGSIEAFICWFYENEEIG